MTPKLLVFDLDGTLIDSRIDLCNSVNATLAHFRQPSLPGATIAAYIGDGVHALVRRSLAHSHAQDPHDDAFIEAAVTWFILYYNQHKLDFTYVYPGVLEAMTAIRSRHRHLAMAVLTNKPVNPSKAICRHFGFDKFCFEIYGGNSFPTKKPDPEGLRALMAAASASPEETVMIGDSHVDVETARAAGTRVLGCAFGLSPETLAAAQPDVTLSSAADWPAALGL
jgi:phosphoglycolate phosphatase